MKSFKFERCKNIRDVQMFAFVGHFSTKSMRTPFVEDTSLSPNFINVPSHQSCFPTATFQMTLTKCLTSYLIVWEIFRNVWIMQDLTDKKLWPCSAHSASLCSCKSALNGHLQLFSPLGRKILCECSQLVKIQKKQPFFNYKIPTVALYIQPNVVRLFLSQIQVAERSFLRMSKSLSGSLWWIVGVVG